MTDSALAAQLIERMDAQTAELRALRAEVAALTAAKLLTREEAAEVIDCSPKTFDRMRARGTAPRPKIDDGRVIRWDPNEIAICAAERRKKRRRGA